MKPISRRKLLSQASHLGSTLAVGLPLAGTPRDLLAREPAEAAHKLKVIVTGGHPGDPEYGCGGTVARYTDLGHAVVLLYLNRGDPAAKEPDDASGIRTAEAAKACEILKARATYAGQRAEAFIRHVQSPDFGLPGACRHDHEP